MKKFKITSTLLSLFLVLSLVATTAFTSLIHLPYVKEVIGNQVTVLQNRLNQLGFNCGRPDGVLAEYKKCCYGISEKNSLKTDGIVGREQLLSCLQLLIPIT